MNTRKPTDYSAMYSTLDQLMVAGLPQTELYFEIGGAVCARPEKGAAVMAAEYLQENYPKAKGFSPRNLRRMREFYRAYTDNPELRALAQKLGWTQNAAILEGCESSQERAWYLRAAQEHRWTKAELLEQIQADAWLWEGLDEPDNTCYTESNTVSAGCLKHDEDPFCVSRQYLSEPDGRVCDEGLGEEDGVRGQFQIDSAATSREEIGNPVYPPARRKLAEHGTSCGGHAARQLRNSDYEEYDLLIGMDKANLRNMYHICGGDFNDKMHLLMENADRPDQEVADPRYTGDFDITWRDVLKECREILGERGLTFGTVFLDCPKSRPLFYPQSLAIQGFCRNKLLVRFWTLKSKQLKIETEAAENLEFELLFPETELLLFPEKCVLILLWCLKVQSGMRAFLIIESNVFVNLLSQFSFRAVIIAIKLLLLEHSKEGFHHGVVVRRSRVGKRLRDF